MAIKIIVKAPTAILYTKTQKIKDITQEARVVIQDLKDTLNHAKNPEGAGLSAPQIGVSKRICIVRRYLSDFTKAKAPIIEEYVLINPKIISFSKETELDWEGCLSIPDTFGKVERASKIKIRALNENGEEIKMLATGFFARVIQHEMDHLDGILFTSKIIGNIMTERALDKFLALSPQKL